MKRYLILALLIACGSDRAAFRPTDNVTRSAPGGQPAASYEIRDGEGRPSHVRVNVYSRGAYEDNNFTYARIVVEIRNTGTQNVSLDARQLRLEAYADNGALLPHGQLVQTIGSALYVPPGEVTSVELVYALGDIEPDHIGSLRLRWVLEHDDGKRYVQFTDFRRVRETIAHGIYYYDPIYGYYDPFLYGPPYGYHLRARVPVGRVIIRDRDRPRTVIRDHR